jgi:hypothetical protein
MIDTSPVMHIDHDDFGADQDVNDISGIEELENLEAGTKEKQQWAEIILFLWTIHSSN